MVNLFISGAIVPFIFQPWLDEMRTGVLLLTGNRHFSSPTIIWKKFPGSRSSPDKATTMPQPGSVNFLPLDFFGDDTSQAGIWQVKDTIFS